MRKGTCTSIKDVIVYAAATANKSTSPLMSTKANFDKATLSWIHANALRNLTAEQNLIIMNDFIDGATTYTAFELSQIRFATKLSAATGPTTPAAAAIAEVASQVSALQQTTPLHIALEAQKTTIQVFSGTGVSQSQSAQAGTSPQLGAQIGGSQSQSTQAGAPQTQTAPSGAAAGFLHVSALESTFASPAETNETLSEALPEQQSIPSHVALLAQRNVVQQFSGAGFSQSQSAQVGTSQPTWGQNSGSRSQSVRGGSSQTGGFPSGAAGGFLHTFALDTGVVPPLEANTAPSVTRSAEDRQIKAREDLRDIQANEALLQSVVERHSATLDATEAVTDEQKRALTILQLAHREAEVAKNSQEVVLDLAKRRVSTEAGK